MFINMFFFGWGMKKRLIGKKGVIVQSQLVKLIIGVAVLVLGFMIYKYLFGSWQGAIGEFFSKYWKNG